jgi:hypothetical protein
LKGNDTYLFNHLTTRMLPAIVVIIPASSCFVSPAFRLLSSALPILPAFNFLHHLDDEELDELALDVEGGPD